MKVLARNRIPISFSPGFEFSVFNGMRTSAASLAAELEHNGFVRIPKLFNPKFIDSKWTD